MANESSDTVDARKLSLSTQTHLESPESKDSRVKNAQMWDRWELSGLFRRISPNLLILLQKQLETWAAVGFPAELKVRSRLFPSPLSAQSL